MPLPNPKSDESKDEYISRFMSWWSDEDSKMDRDQALAAAYDKWKKKDKDKDKESDGKVARHLVDFIEESAGKVADKWKSIRSKSGQPKEAMLKQAASEEAEKVDDEVVEEVLNEYPGLLESVAKAIEGGAKDIIIKNRAGTSDRPRSPMPGIGLGGGGLRGIPDGTGPLAQLGMCRSMPMKLEKESARGKGVGVGGPAQQDGGTDKCQCPECGNIQSKPRGTPCAEQTCNNCGHEGMVGVGEKQAEMVRRDVKEFLKEAEGNLLDKGLNWFKKNPRALNALFGGGIGSLIGGLAGGNRGALAGLGIGGGAGYFGGEQIKDTVAPWINSILESTEGSPRADVRSSGHPDEVARLEGYRQGLEASNDPMARADRAVEIARQRHDVGQGTEKEDVTSQALSQALKTRHHQREGTTPDSKGPVSVFDVESDDPVANFGSYLLNRGADVGDWIVGR